MTHSSSINQCSGCGCAPYLKQCTPHTASPTQTDTLLGSKEGQSRTPAARLWWPVGMRTAAGPPATHGPAPHHLYSWLISRCMQEALRSATHSACMRPNRLQLRDLHCASQRTDMHMLVPDESSSHPVRRPHACLARTSGLREARSQAFTLQNAAYVTHSASARSASPAVAACRGHTLEGLARAHTAGSHQRACLLPPKPYPTLTEGREGRRTGRAGEARLQDGRWERRHAREQLLLQPVRRVIDHEVGRRGCRRGRACPPPT